MKAVFFLDAMSCCLALGLGLFALIRKAPPGRPRQFCLDLAFAALCLVIGAGSFGSAFFMTSKDASEAAWWFHTFAFAWYLSPGLFLVFSMMLTGVNTPFAFAALIFLPGIAVFAAHVTDPHAVLASVTQIPLGWHTNYTENSYWHWFNVANYSSCALAAIVLLARATLSAQDGRIRIRAGIVLFTIIPAFFGTFLTGFVVRYFGVETLPPMMPLFLSILVVGLAIALFRYDLLELTPTSAADRILASVRDAVVLVDGEGKIIDTNLAGPTRRGLATDAIRGESLAVLLPAAAEGAAWLAKRAVVGEEPFETNFAFEPDRMVPGAVTVRTVAGPDGGQLGYIVTAHDLSAEKDLAEELKRRIAATTALRSVEERFSHAFWASPAGMLIVEGFNRMVLDANEAAADIFGADVTSLVGKSTNDLGFYVAPEDLDPVLELLSKGETASARELTVERADGRRVRCLVAASPLEFGGKEAAVFTLIDVTELDRLRDEVAKAQKLDSIGMLAGGIAHDFNNILTAVMGNISLARLSVKDGDEAADALDRSEAACLRARDLAGQLLTFAKGGDPSPEPTDVLMLLREAVRMATAGSSTAANFSVESKLPLAFVDPGQILQVFNNIALNAVQAMSEGGTLSLRSRLVTVGPGIDYPEGVPPKELIAGDYIAVDLQDNGPGIAPQLIGRIFDPYVTTKRKGSGLGLAICYSILKRHRGAISVSSTLGQGTRFTVFLPAARPEALSAALRHGPTDRVRRTSTKTPSFGRGAVLLMDDELAIRSTTEKLLRRLGYEPTTCVDGDAAVAAFIAARTSGRAFAAVILDLTVPAGMGGAEAAKIIRQLDPDVPLFVSSGYADTSVLSDYAAFGFNGVIPKPYGIEELGRKLSGE